MKAARARHVPVDPPAAAQAPVALVPAALDPPGAPGGELAHAPSFPDRHDAPIADRASTRLLIACPDRPGLIAAVSGFLAAAGLNITDADQHSSAEGRLFMRMVFDSPLRSEREALYARFDAEIATRWRWTTASPSRRSQARGDHGLPRGPLPRSTCSGAGAPASSRPTWSR